MPVPSRRKNSSRSKRSRSVKRLSFKKKFLGIPKINCSVCQKEKRFHFVCLNCERNNK